MTLAATIAVLVISAPGTVVMPLAGDGLTAEELTRVDRAVRAAAAQLSVDGERTVTGKASRKQLELRLTDATGVLQARSVTALDLAHVDEGASAGITALGGEQARHAQMTVHAASGASILVDGAARGTGPTTFISPVDPGRHSVVARVNGRRDQEKVVDVVLGDSADVDLVSTLDAHTTAPAAASAASAVPWVLAGAGAAVAVIGGALTVLGVGPYLDLKSAAHELDALDVEGRGESPRANYAAAVADARNKYDHGVSAWNQYGEALVISGAAVVGAGIATSTTALIVGLGE